MADHPRTPRHADFLRNLRQARRFLDKPVSQDIVDEVLAAARETAGDDVPDWQFLVIDDLVTRKALAAAGTFSGILARAAVVIVAVRDGEATPSKANLEGRIADRIMLAAGRHGLAGGSGWFSTGEAQAEVRVILGLPPQRQALVAVGIGYVDTSTPGAASSLQRVRASLDALAGDRPKPDNDA